MSDKSIRKSNESAWPNDELEAAEFHVDPYLVRNKFCLVNIDQTIDGMGNVLWTCSNGDVLEHV